MINKRIFTGLTILGLTLSVGCATNKEANLAKQEADAEIYEVVSQEQFDPVIIKVAGYGTYGKTSVEVNENQKNLLAIRASKMDAYRNLAERIYGTRIQGNTSVHNLATTDDNIRGYVDNLVRGAKVVATREIGKGSYETQMEVVLEPRFQQCLLRSNSLSAKPVCAQYTIHGEHTNQRLPITGLDNKSVYLKPVASNKAKVAPKQNYEAVEVASQPNARYFID